MKHLRIYLIGFALAAVVGCSSSQPQTGFYSPPVDGKPSKSNPVVKVQPNVPAPAKSTVPADFPSPPQDHMMGVASWYGPGFHGKKTANGEEYDQMGLTAAHRLLPMDTWVRVTNQENGKSIVVRVNDRGPYKKNRIIDLTQTAAEQLGFFNQGTAPVTLEVLKYPENFDPKMGFDPYRQVVIQLAVYKEQERAENMKKELQVRFRELSFKVDQPAGGIFQVVAGPFEDRESAGAVSDVLKQMGLDTFVRSYRK